MPSPTQPPNTPRAGSSGGGAGAAPPEHDGGPPNGERCGAVVCQFGECVQDADAPLHCRCKPGYFGKDCSRCTVFVDALSNCREGCGDSWSSPLRDLQQAIDRAAERGYCEVWVADGTYYPTTGTERTASFRLREQVGVYGGFEGGESSREDRDIASQPTTLSGDIGVEGDDSDNSFHVLRGADNSILNGFRIVGGHADAADTAGFAGGGGMVNDGVFPVIEDCEFAFNYAEAGGGAMLNRNGSPKIIRTRFVNNHATGAGGAMLNDAASPEILESVLELSSAQEGGAIYNRNGAGPRIYRSILRHNAAKGYGGAIRNQGASPEIEDTTFEDNFAAGGGGAMYSDSSERPDVRGCVFAANITDGQGGALHTVASGLLVTNSVFVGNMAMRAGAISNYDSNLMLINSTLVANASQIDAAGVLNVYRGRRGGAAIVNSILWGNVPEQLTSIGEALKVTYSTVEGGCTATGGESPCTTDDTGNRADDPLFERMPMPGTLDPDFDLRLRDGSPCIDAAQTAAAPATDLEGQARVREADMGAYEYPR